MKRICLSVFVLYITALSQLAFAQTETFETTTVYRKGMAGYSTFRIPAVVRTKGDVLLAFAEARRDNGGDAGNIDLVVRRSEDGGRTWGEMIVVWDDADNTCGNPAPVVDSRSGRVVLLMTWNKGEDKEKDIMQFRSVDTRCVYVAYSDDEGVSWSKPLDITSTVKLPTWGWYATGPCHALQLRGGANEGRLVVPCDHSVQVDGEIVYNSHLILSDDGGATWRIGATLKGGNESTAVQLKDGSIMLNARWQLGDERFARHYAISDDGGETMGDVVRDETLIEPVCQGTIIGYQPKSRPVDDLLFCNPASTKRRELLTLRRSRDGGKSWSEGIVINSGPSAYSDIVVLKGGDVGVLCEVGEKSPYERIDFRVVPKQLVREQ